MAILLYVRINLLLQAFVPLFSQAIIFNFVLTFIEAALNLFINSNAQELLKEMKPALRTKLTLVIRNFMDRLFAKIPLEDWINLN